MLTVLNEAQNERRVSPVTIRHMLTVLTGCRDELEAWRQFCDTFILHYEHWSQKTRLKHPKNQRS